jgi:putative hemolysin
LGAVVLLVVLQSFFSATKSAMINLTPARINQLVEQGRARARLVAQLTEDSTRLLATFQFWTMLMAALAVGVAALTLVSPLQTAFNRIGVLESASAPLGGAIVILAVATLSLIVGDLVPEAVGAAHAEALAFVAAWPVAALAFFTAPLIKLVIGVSSRLSALAGGESLPGMPFITEEEIMTLVDAGQEVGVIEEDAKEMIYSVFALGDTLSREVMVPRIDIVALDVQSSLDRALHVVISAGHSRIPVYEGNIDNIVGVLYAKDLLKLWYDKQVVATLHEVLREAYFVPESKKVDELLEDMQQSKVHIAIVVDEYGGTAGVVTVEDIVEEIVGEIQDEYDAEEPVVEQIAAREYIFDARVDLDDFNRHVGTEFPTEMDDTLGGFIYSQLGKIPAPGESLRFNGLVIEVLTVTGRRIRKVRVSWEQQGEDENDKADAT